VEGLLAKPTVSKANRNYETVFLNGRYIKSTLISKAIEEGYRSYMMQHKFPFCILSITVDPELVDVNVHPTKMEVRFTDCEFIYDYLVSCIHSNLKIHDMIPDVSLQEKGKEDKVVITAKDSPEPFEVSRIRRNLDVDETVESVDSHTSEKNVDNFEVDFSVAEAEIKYENEEKCLTESVNKENAIAHAVFGSFKPDYIAAGRDNIIKANRAVIVNKPVQMDLFDEGFLNKKEKANYKILGQLFDTYWLISYEDKLLIMDQHAAHEKVKYERLLLQLKEKQCETQTIEPPMIITATGKEQTVLEQFEETFLSMGFLIEHFGGNEYAIRSVPLDLYGRNELEMFREILEELTEDTPKGTPDFILEKLASMACKAAVKGNNSMSMEEVETLIKELMELDNPYHCPHGRPTLISMSKYEIEKKFKRIV